MRLNTEIILKKTWFYIFLSWCLFVNYSYSTESKIRFSNQPCANDDFIQEGECIQASEPLEQNVDFFEIPMEQCDYNARKVVNKDCVFSIKCSMEHEVQSNVDEVSLAHGSNNSKIVFSIVGICEAVEDSCPRSVLTCLKSTVRQVIYPHVGDVNNALNTKFVQGDYSIIEVTK